MQAQPREVYSVSHGYTGWGLKGHCEEGQSSEKRWFWGALTLSLLPTPDPGLLFPPPRFTLCSFENARGTPGGVSFCVGPSASLWKADPTRSTVGAGPRGCCARLDVGES